MNKVEARLAELQALWQKEQVAVREQVRAAREGKSLRERCEMGVALRDLEVVETDAVAGDLVRVWLEHPSHDLERFTAGAGHPVRLWATGKDEKEAAFALGVLARKETKRVAVVIDAEDYDNLSSQHLHLDLEANEASFTRGLKGIARFLSADKESPSFPLRQTLFADEKPTARPLQATPIPLDTALNAPQQDAVTLALSTAPVAVVFGPPGTGKTRTLVEIIRQCHRRGERVLVTAASNTAVDNVVERLMDEGESPLRIGHPARVSDQAEAATLDAKIDRTAEKKLSREWIRAAVELRRQIARRQARGQLRFDERKRMQREAQSLMRDARRELRKAEQRLLSQHRIVCATASGSDARVLSNETFDVVVLDEATQCVTPLALAALARAPRAILAGDHKQLPPTVIDREASAGGLSSTLFEQVVEAYPESVAMLRVQHRMHERIMAFPSASMYGGQLEAAPSNRSHTLEDLGIAPDPLRNSELVFIDTAGAGYGEQRTADDPSLRNEEQAARTAAECERLLRRGLAPAQIAVITPYAAQARTLRARLQSAVHQGLEVDTVDGFQGREKEAILVDLVRSNEDAQLGFLSDTRRMNVALTRAKRCLLVIGDSATMGGHPFYGAFLQLVEAQGLYVSVFADDPSDPL